MIIDIIIINLCQVVTFSSSTRFKDFSGFTTPFNDNDNDNDNKNNDDNNNNDYNDMCIP